MRLRAAELERELVRAQADLEHERALAQERLATLNDAQERLSASFKALSAEALQASMAQLTELRARSCRPRRPRPRAIWTSASQAVEQLVAPLKEQLGRVDSSCVALDRERRESRGRLEAQLRTLTETGEKLRTETGALVTALRKPNARGQWGQMQLRKVVELAGMVRHCDFAEQAVVRRRRDGAAARSGRQPARRQARRGRRQGAAAGRARRIRGARRGPSAMRHLQDHARLLRKHVKQLADKAYWAGLDSAPDFVVMFLPGRAPVRRRARGRSRR